MLNEKWNATVGIDEIFSLFPSGPEPEIRGVQPVCPVVLLSYIGCREGGGSLAWYVLHEVRLAPLSSSSVGSPPLHSTTTYLHTVAACQHTSKDLARHSFLEAQSKPHSYISSQ